MSARTRIERFRSANPGAADLATLCSPAVLVEPELLRRLRLLLPGADITAESDLWGSELLAGASARGIALDPLVADELRADLRLPRWSALRTVAWQHIADCHRTLHWSLRLEEQINRHVVDGGDAAAVERILLAAVGELVIAARDGESATRVGIARWLVGAIARLPRRVATTDATHAAGLAAGLHLDGRVPATAAPLSDHWLPWLLTTVGAARVRIPVRFADGVLEANSTGADTVYIEVPGTQPMVLDVDWHDGRTPHATRLTFTDTPANCPVHADEVTLTTLAGARTRLRRTRTTPAGLDFTAQRAHHRPYFDRQGLVDRAARAVEDVSWALLTGSEGIGKTALACAVADRLERRGWVVAQHFYGVDPAWDDQEVIAASLESQLRAAVPDADWSRPVAGQPGALWNAFERISEVGKTRVLVLVDGIPGGSSEETTRWLFNSMLSSNARPGFHFLLTGPFADGADAWLETPDSRRHINLDDSNHDVSCAAILKHHEPALRDVWETEPSPSELIDLAGSNPGRLTRIIDWLRAQPSATATLDRIPRSLTVRMDRVWRELTALFPREDIGRWFAAIAVALDNLTVDDACLLTRIGNSAELISAAVAFGLIRVDGSLDDGSSVVTAEPSLAAAIEAEFGVNSLIHGHAQHAEAFPVGDVGSASRYQISSAMHHFSHADRNEILELPRTGEFLRRRACQDGVTAVLDDFHKSPSYTLNPIRRAVERVADVAARRPDRFVELIVAELHRQGETVPPELPGDWPPPLFPRWVRHPEEAPARRIDTRVTAVAWRPGLQYFAHVGPDGLTVRDLHTEQMSHVPIAGATGVVLYEEDIAVAAGAELRLYGGDAMKLLFQWRTTSPVTVLDSFSGTLVAGTRSGVILLIRNDNAPRHLVGHGAAISALAEHRGRLVSASLDGTVRLWDLSTGSLVRTLRHRGPVRHVVSQAADIVTADDTGRVHWWHPDTGEELRRLRGHDAPVTALHAMDGATTMSAAADGTMWLWHRADPDRDRQLTDSGPAIVGALRDQFTKRAFITWDDKAHVIRWDDAGTPTPYLLAGELQPPVRTIFPGAKDYIAVDTGGIVTIPRRPEQNPDALSTRRPIVVVGPETVVLGMPNAVLHHNVRSGRWSWGKTGAESLAEYRLSLPSHVPETTAWSQREGEDLIGTARGDVMLVREGHDSIVATVPTPVTAAAAAAGQRWCVIGTSDGSVYRWHPEESLLTVLGRHDGPVAGLAAAGRRFAASTSEDGTVRLWDVLNGVEHAMVAGPEPFYGITFAGLERMYVRSGEDGLWCVDLLATDTDRRDEELEGRSLADGVFDLSAHVPFEIRAVQPLRSSGFGAGECRVTAHERGRFAERVGGDGRLAVPWRFAADRRVLVRVEPESPLHGVRVAYVTLNRRDERWLTIELDEEER